MPKITVIPGDGIGPEIVAEAVKVLRAIGTRCNHIFEIEMALAGGAAIDHCGEPLPQETIALCQASDAVLLGAVGGPQWDHMLPKLRPEQAILGLRKELGLFGNLRPVKLFPALRDSSPLRLEILESGIDLLIVRELTGGIYFGPRQRSTEEGQEIASDLEVYSASEIERIMHMAFTLAAGRRNKVISVDKANVLESSRLWREIAIRIASHYPQVELEHMYVDNCAMQLILNPGQFDVVVTSNMFGDILSDEASVLTGSIGMLPSASLRGDSFGLYEPSHGSAPDIAGQGKANPLATILSVALMLRSSLGLHREAAIVERAVEHVLESGKRTADIGKGTGRIVNTVQMGDYVAETVLTI